MAEVCAKSMLGTVDGAISEVCPINVLGAKICMIIYFVALISESRLGQVHIRCWCKA